MSRKYPLCFKCGDKVDVAITAVRVVCEECAESIEGQRKGKFLMVELEYEMESEDTDTWEPVGDPTLN